MSIAWAAIIYSTTSTRVADNKRVSLFIRKINGKIERSVERNINRVKPAFYSKRGFGTKT